jgi:hypothetical protein
MTLSDAVFGLVDHLFSTPMALWVVVASALFAIVLMLVIVVAMRRAERWEMIVLFPLTASMMFLAAIASLDFFAQAQLATEKRALISRDLELLILATQKGSALGCLAGATNDVVDASCEKAIFATPQSTANAIAFVWARMRLFADAMVFAPSAEPGFADRFSDLRRTIEADRFGIAAHILAWRDGCTAKRCPFFAGLHDARVLKSNLHVNVFDQYVSRYAAAWDKVPKVDNIPSESKTPALTSPLIAVSVGPDKPARATVPVPRRYDFPSAASIPPVSIMTAEPPVTKDATEPPVMRSDSGVKVPMPRKRPVRSEIHIRTKL